MANLGPANFTDSEAPEIICPKCSEVWEDDPTGLADEGDERKCPHCGARLVCDEKDVHIYWVWSVMEETKS